MLSCSSCLLPSTVLEVLVKFGAQRFQVLGCARACKEAVAESIWMSALFSSAMLAWASADPEDANKVPELRRQS